MTRTVPDGFGGWDNGSRDPVPASSSILRWRYDAAFDAVWRDRIMYAVASVDYELPSVRLLYSLSDSPAPYQIHFDLDDSPPDATCTTVGEGGCLLGRTTCGTYGATVDAVGADGVTRFYRTCSQFRIRVYVEHLRAKAAAKGVDEAEYAHCVLRHEVGHALGLRHEVADLNRTVSPCARAMLEAFSTDPADSTWVAVPTPTECT